MQKISKKSASTKWHAFQEKHTKKDNFFECFSKILKGNPQLQKDECGRLIQKNGKETCNTRLWKAVCGRIFAELSLQKDKFWKDHCKRIFVEGYLRNDQCGNKLRSSGLNK